MILQFNFYMNLLLFKKTSAVLWKNLAYFGRHKTSNIPSAPSKLKKAEQNCAEKT